MILADTSIWIDHFRIEVAELTARPNAPLVLGHPIIIGELALGNLQNRSVTLAKLAALPPALVADRDAVLSMTERDRLFGLGIGFSDAHLLASVRAMQDVDLWTRDRKLKATAERFGVAHLELAGSA